MTSARKTANNKSQETERTPQELQRTLTPVSPSDPRPRNPSQNAPHTKRRTVRSPVTKMLPLKAVRNDTTQADPQQITRAFPDIHHCPAQHKSITNQNRPATCHQPGRRTCKRPPTRPFGATRQAHATSYSRYSTKIHANPWHVKGTLLSRAPPKPAVFDGDRRLLA